MAKATPTDPLRAQLYELLEQVQNHSAQLRDYASVPGNAWLAKSEAEAIARLGGDIEALIEEIRQADAEDGF